MAGELGLIFIILVVAIVLGGAAIGVAQYEAIHNALGYNIPNYGINSQNVIDNYTPTDCAPIPFYDTITVIEKKSGRIGDECMENGKPSDYVIIDSRKYVREANPAAYCKLEIGKTYKVILIDMKGFGTYKCHYVIIRDVVEEIK